VCGLVFLKPLSALLTYSLENENASHLVVIPLIVAWLLLLDRQKLPRASRLDLPASLPLAAAAALIGGFATWRFSLRSVPLPGPLLNRFICVLQLGSTVVAEWIFSLSAVPFLREGFVFHLTGWNIEVARECSGIRSSIALLALAILAAHFSFGKLWKKFVFVAVGILMMVVKNGVRPTLTCWRNRSAPVSYW
jgi:exosortase/archaeosortase family protein